MAASAWLGHVRGGYGRASRNVANILHAAAKLKVALDVEPMRALLDESCALAGDMNAQDGANSLWALAKLGCWTSASSTLSCAPASIVRAT